MNLEIKGRRAYNSGPSKVLSIPKFVWEYLKQNYGEDIIFDFKIEDNKLIWTINNEEI